ncbi:hypothetical protein BLNAU_20374 [Blattamonas nauphoetae]|uniref:Uncharacterized protein n=1 Tax=Blattamonas nauphoetae TaxID=2049346 RepID=A0ABQ9X250_9EUKA|nr:hypothetical protein BLNAU_20374 [Blattamonas nauphoetae]
MPLSPHSLPLPSHQLPPSLIDHSLPSSESNRLPFNPNETDDKSTLASSIVNSDLHRGSTSSLTLSQTITDPSSASLSLETPPPSPDTPTSFSSPTSDTAWMISTLHNLISAPVLQSSSQHSNDDPNIFDVVRSLRQPLINERFNVSLFDEEDDETIVNSLARCFSVWTETKTLSHIDDPPAFVDRLLWTLRSSHARLRIHSYLVLMSIILERGVECVNESHLHNLRFAFRDGTKEEQTFLIGILVAHFEHLTKTNTPRFKQELSTFDFDGFVTADLSDPYLFHLVISFVMKVWAARAFSFETRVWVKDFLLRFENHQNALVRVCGFLKNMPSLFSFDASFLNASLDYATLLTLYGIPFPEEFTRILLNDQTHINSILASLYLNHTSLNPQYRRKIFPIGLLFERQARSDANAFLEVDARNIAQTSALFLHTPLFGLHSLLVRGFFQSLSDEDIFNLVRLLARESNEIEVQYLAIDLFTLFPPPLVIRLLMTTRPLKMSSIAHLGLFLSLSVMVVRTVGMSNGRTKRRSTRTTDSGHVQVKKKCFMWPKST